MGAHGSIRVSHKFTLSSSPRILTPSQPIKSPLTVTHPNTQRFQ
jgi:hypothetical protein